MDVLYEESMEVSVLRVQGSEKFFLRLTYRLQQMRLGSKKLVSSTTKSAYIDSWVFVPTSNVRERLMSVTGFSFGYTCKRFLLVPFEQQTFLKVNAEYWSLSDVKHIVSSKKLKREFTK